MEWLVQSCLMVGTCTAALVELADELLDAVELAGGLTCYELAVAEDGEEGQVVYAGGFAGGGVVLGIYLDEGDLGLGLGEAGKLRGDHAALSAPVGVVLDDELRVLGKGIGPLGVGDGGDRHAF